MTEKTANKISKVRLESIWLIIIDIRPLIDNVKRNHNNLFISLIKLLSFIIIFSSFFLCSISICWKMIKKYYFLAIFFSFFCDEVCKNLIVVVATIYSRYTLTWNEGSFPDSGQSRKMTIYPHAQWGNSAGNPSSWENTDIPSHTMREHQVLL